MKLLLDTNIFLEVILEQENSSSAKALLSDPKKHELFVSDFSLHSIGILLFRRSQHAAFERFVEDVVLTRCTQVVGLISDDLKDVPNVAREMQLDFDDAYQAVVARKWVLDIVSFDRDFDRSGLRRWTPAQINQQ